VKISIIVPAYYEEKFLSETLAQIKLAADVFTGIGCETELIVCDNNSTDHTADIARLAGANVVSESVNQISRARNSGAAVTTGDWLVFMDADSHPSAELFADVVNEIQSGKCIAGGSTFCWDQKQNFIIELLMPVVNVGFRWRRMLCGVFIFIETATFRKLGGFSHEAFAGEELELSQRLKRLAKETGKRFIILHRHPVVTSARRMGDYTVFTPIKVLYHNIFHPHRYTTTREAARRWYDGRRW
jgi:glycosyltransferase involved in cell wall biosynthesis